jgi:hypothetical protein
MTVKFSNKMEKGINTIKTKISDAIMHPIQKARGLFKGVVSSGAVITSLSGPAYADTRALQEVEKQPSIDHTTLSIPDYQFTNTDGTQRTQEEVLEGLRDGNIKLNDPDGTQWDVSQMNYKNSNKNLYEKSLDTNITNLDAPIIIKGNTSQQFAEFCGTNYEYTNPNTDTHYPTGTNTNEFTVGYNASGKLNLYNKEYGYQDPNNNLGGNVKMNYYADKTDPSTASSSYIPQKDIGQLCDDLTDADKIASMIEGLVKGGVNKANTEKAVEEYLNLPPTIDVTLDDTTQSLDEQIGNIDVNIIAAENIAEQTTSFAPIENYNDPNNYIKNIDDLKFALNTLFQSQEFLDYNNDPSDVNFAKLQMFLNNNSLPVPIIDIDGNIHVVKVQGSIDKETFDKFIGTLYKKIESNVKSNIETQLDKYEESILNDPEISELIKVSNLKININNGLLQLNLGDGIFKLIKLNLADEKDNYGQDTGEVIIDQKTINQIIKLSDQYGSTNANLTPEEVENYATQTYQMPVIGGVLRFGSNQENLTNTQIQNIADQISLAIGNNINEAKVSTLTIGNKTLAYVNINKPYQDNGIAYTISTDMQLTIANDSHTVLKNTEVVEKVYTMRNYTNIPIEVRDTVIKQFEDKGFTATISGDGTLFVERIDIEQAIDDGGIHFTESGGIFVMTNEGDKPLSEYGTDTGTEGTETTDTETTDTETTGTETTDTETTDTETTDTETTGTETTDTETTGTETTDTETTGTETTDTETTGTETTDTETTGTETTDTETTGTETTDTETTGTETTDTETTGTETTDTTKKLTEIGSSIIPDDLIKLAGSKEILNNSLSNAIKEKLGNDFNLAIADIPFVGGMIIKVVQATKVGSETTLSLTKPITVSQDTDGNISVDLGDQNIKLIKDNFPSDSNESDEKKNIITYENINDIEDQNTFKKVVDKVIEKLKEVLEDIKDIIFDSDTDNLEIITNNDNSVNVAIEDILGNSITVNNGEPLITIDQEKIENINNKIYNLNNPININNIDELTKLQKIQQSKVIENLFNSLNNNNILKIQIVNNKLVFTLKDKDPYSNRLIVTHNKLIVTTDENGNQNIDPKVVTDINEKITDKIEENNNNNNTPLTPTTVPDPNGSVTTQPSKT